MGTEPFLGQIMPFSFNFAPKGWALCNGQQLAINSNQALFSLLGTTYGGNGQTTFALPNLQGRVPIHWGNSPFANTYTWGEVGGEESHTLSIPEMPTHNHLMRADAATAAASNAGTPTAGSALGQSVGSSGSNSFATNIYTSSPSNIGTLAPQAIDNAGGNQPHENRQPFLTLNYCIALTGIFPSRD